MRNAPSHIKSLSQQFAAWEKRWRGWDIAQCPIHLEPEFHPFLCHYVPLTHIDDGIRPTLLSNIASYFKKPRNPTATSSFIPEPYNLYPYVSTDELIYLHIFLPQQYVAKQSHMEHVLEMLAYCTEPMSFELIATHEKICIQVVCRASLQGYVSQLLKAHIPGIVIQVSEYEKESLFLDTGYIITVDLGLKEEYMRPIACKFDADSYVNVFAGINHLQPGERVVLQILFNGLVNDWRQSITNAVSDNSGKESFFYDAPEMPKLAAEKIAAPLFAVTIRIMGQGMNANHALHVANTLAIPFLHLSISPYNGLIALDGGTYEFDTRINDMLDRTSHRSGMLLNAKELSQLMHFPTVALSKKLQSFAEKTKAAPASTFNSEYILGANTHEGITTEVSLSIEQRLKHLHLIGATGTGKSTLLLNLITQDIHAGNGCAVLDPHGDLIEAILSRIPPSRIKDVVVIDPSDSEYPISFNILTAHSDIEKEILASDLVAIFRRLSTSWGDQMNSVFANAILAFLESSKGGTLADLRRFLIEKNYREEFLQSVRDEHIIYYWQKEYPLLKSSSVGSILTRLDSFLRPKVIRNMVTQQKSLDFEQLMDSKKIVLVKLSHGLIGAENSYLLGSFIVSKIQQAAMARQVKAKAERSPYFLYIDEFHQFTTHSMSLILEGARKYSLGLVLAHQSMQQLQKQDSELASSVLANAGTRICFRVGDSDARLFGSNFSSFTAEDLLKLNTGHAISRIERSDCDFNLETSPDSVESNETAFEEIISSSRALYAHQIDINTEVQQEKKAEPIPTKEVVAKPVVKAEAPKTPPPQTNLSDTSETVKRLVQQKEQSQHRQLQTLIKKAAEAQGYKAIIEKPILEGTGRVDVSLEKDTVAIACEVSVSTDAAWEIHNIEKCIKAGYSHVVVCVVDTSTRNKLEEHVLIRRLTQVTITTVEAFIALLSNQAQGTTSTIKGYRVNVAYNASNDEQKIQRISKILKDTNNRKPQ